MEKNHLVRLGLGILLFALGIMGAVSANNIYSSLSIFSGAILTVSPQIFSRENWRAVVSYSALFRKPRENESLFVARLFLSMSFVAQTSGILALVYFMKKINYNNYIYRSGINMIIDGIDEDFTKSCLCNLIRSVKRSVSVKISLFRQIGTGFLLAGVFGGFGALASYSIRIFNGNAVSSESMGISLAMTAVFLLVSATFNLLLPSNFRMQSVQVESIQKQVLIGLYSLQAGDNYRVVLHNQCSFLRQDEIEMLKEEPLLRETKEGDTARHYDKTAEDIRKLLREMTV
ncbi:MAG: hypothetical protein IKN12_03265 [Selenomonadaceae bacterium]|nr:hypothetical protein [Selenomonadaceae bacterium]